MDERSMTLQQIEEYVRYLRTEEKSAATIKQYQREVQRFYLWLPDGKRLGKEQALAYKEALQDRKKAVSVNASLAALNSFFRFMAWPELALKPMKTQRRIFCEESRELDYEDYLRLVEAAERSWTGRDGPSGGTACCAGGGHRPRRMGVVWLTVTSSWGNRPWGFPMACGVTGCWAPGRRRCRSPARRWR